MIEREGEDWESLTLPMTDPWLVAEERLGWKALVKELTDEERSSLAQIIKAKVEGWMVPGLASYTDEGLKQRIIEVSEAETAELYTSLEDLAPPGINPIAWAYLCGARVSLEETCKTGEAETLLEAAYAAYWARVELNRGSSIKEVADWHWGAVADSGGQEFLQSFDLALRKEDKEVKELIKETVQERLEAGGFSVLEN